MKINKVHTLHDLTPDDIYLIRKTTGIELAVATNDGSAALTLKRRVKLSGPTSLFYGEIGTYTIKEYTELTPYTLTSSDGTVSRNGSSISFACSNEALATASFTLNDRVFTIAMKAIVVEAPAIVSPVDGATEVAVTGLTVTASAFSLNYSGETDTIVSTDWEVATDPAFTNVVASSYDDTVNLTSWTIPS